MGAFYKVDSFSMFLPLSVKVWSCHSAVWNGGAGRLAGGVDTQLCEQLKNEAM